jgi:hypothetical protein
MKRPRKSPETKPVTPELTPEQLARVVGGKTPPNPLKNDTP